MLYPYFKIDKTILRAAEEAEQLAAPQIRRIEEITDYNQQKMLAAFQEAGVSESHFVASDVYKRQRSAGG